VIFLVIFQANAKRNFDETVEAHVRLGIKKERTDQVHTLGRLRKLLAYFKLYLICVEFEWLNWNFLWTELLMVGFVFGFKSL
jgi:hypothetical protein